MIETSALDDLPNLIADRVFDLLKSNGAMNKKDAACYLAISGRMIDKYVASGELRKGLHGAKPFFRVKDLDALLASKMQPQSEVSDV